MTGKSMPKWVRYGVASTTVVALAVAVFLAWIVSLQPLAPRRPVGGRTAPDHASMLGCYDIVLQNWHPPLSLGEDGVFTMPPRTIELTSLTGRGRDFLARAVVRKSEWLPFGSWEVTPERTLSLTWSNGFSGVAAELGPQGETLTGRAYTFWDFPRVTQWAAMTAVRVSCPGPSFGGK
jgi:hypothetical protein